MKIITARTAPITGEKADSTQSYIILIIMSKFDEESYIPMPLVLPCLPVFASATYIKNECQSVPEHYTLVVQPWLTVPVVVTLLEGVTSDPVAVATLVTGD